MGILHKSPPKIIDRTWICVLVCGKRCPSRRLTLSLVKAPVAPPPAAILSRFSNCKRFPWQNLLFFVSSFPVSRASSQTPKLSRPPSDPSLWAFQITTYLSFPYIRHLHRYPLIWKRFIFRLTKQTNGQWEWQLDGLWLHLLLHQSDKLGLLGVSERLPLALMAFLQPGLVLLRLRAEDDGRKSHYSEIITAQIYEKKKQQKLGKQFFFILWDLEITKKER